jgi:predicted dehydrogenase
MSDTISVAVVGLGQMGLHHARVYAKMAGVRIAAVCDTNEQHREAGAKEFSCKVYADFRDLLADPSIDAVSITLPDNMHLEAVKLAVASKKHVLLEKPIAKDIAEGRQIYELVKDYDRVFMVGHLLRYDPRFSAVKDSIMAGELGELVHLYCRRNSPIYGPRRYIGASDLSMHVMIHDIDYVNWFFQSAPVKVFAKGRSVALKDVNMKDVIYALVTYESGAVACFEACWTLPENSPTIIDDKMELVGTKGVAYIDSCDMGVRFITKDRLVYPDSRHWPYVDGAPSGDLCAELTGFIGSICGITKPLITAKEAYDALKVVNAIERSMAEGREVDVERS